MKKSILLVNPNYHYSFTLKNELNKLGWRADIYVNNLYPNKLLYGNDVIREKILINKRNIVILMNRLFFFIKIIYLYKFFYVYGDAEVFTIYRNKNNWLGRYLATDSISPELCILKFFGKKIIFFPNGCHQELLKKDFIRQDGGHLCSNCVVPYASCNDIDNKIIFDKVNKYHDFIVANTPMISPSLPKKTQIKDRFIDLNEFHPDTQIPNEFLLPKSQTVRVLHSFFDSNRSDPLKNVKGSPYIYAAIEKLRSEGIDVEYIYVNNVEAVNMKFIQLQADIVIDQLIYGWWGSTSIECMALGKPVICYLNKDLKCEFFKAFPEYTSLPIFEADKETIYLSLKKLVLDPKLRLHIGKQSRYFSEKHFNAKINSKLFSELLMTL